MTLILTITYFPKYLKHDLVRECQYFNILIHTKTESKALFIKVLLIVSSSTPKT